MNKDKFIIQMVWGVLLVLAGAGVFIRIPHVMPQVEKMGSFSSMMVFVYFCFYLLGILLIGGGAKKLYDNYHKFQNNDQNNN